MSKVLWALPYLPWPVTSGGKARQYHLLRELAARGHRITLLIQSKSPLTREIQEHLEGMVERLIVLPRRPLVHPLNLLAAAFSPRPLLATINGHSPKLTQAFARLLDETWGVIQIEHSYFLQPFLGELQGRNLPFLLTEHNVESSLGAATYQSLPRWMRPYVAFDQWRYRRWERRVLCAAAVVAAVTEEDAEQLQRTRQGAVDVVINGVDARAFSAVKPDYGSRRVLFVGNFEYAPNRDAVQWALDEIWPAVWKQVPDARFAVCGHALPDHWRQRWPDGRIEWVGFAPDLKTEQGASAIFLAAIREGGGSKLKVLEALAAGLPVVTTSQGASGLALSSGENFIGSDRGAGLAEAVVRLMREPASASRIGEAGRRYVCANHDWSRAADQLEGLYGKMAHAHRH